MKIMDLDAYAEAGFYIISFIISNLHNGIRFALTCTTGNFFRQFSQPIV